MEETQKPAPQTPVEEWDDSVREALDLYDAGLNVFPIIRASKEPYGSHSILTTTRLHRPSLPGLVQDSNIAVMTGRLSGNLVVLDCDTWDVFERIKAALDAAGIAAWVRNGIDGGQCWLRCADGEIANAHVDGVEVLGTRLYSAAPPSIHPSGMVYEWVKRGGLQPPLVTLGRLAVLGLGLETVGRRRARGKLHELPVIANRVLVERDTTGYASNSEAEFGACLSLLGVGYDDADVMRFFAMFPTPHYVKVGETHFRKSVLDQARTKQMPRARSASRSLGYLHSSAFVGWAESRPWPGRTGNTDHAVYLALCHRMRLDGGANFRASVREVAELAAVNKETAYKAIGRLVAAGLAHREGTDAQGSSSHYSLSPQILPDAESVSFNFTVPDNETRTVGETYAPVGNSVRISAHDVWHRDALGKSALACWTEMQKSQGLTVAVIAERSGRKPPTVRRALEKLKDHGLAFEDDGQWYAADVTIAALDQIALEQGTLGRADGRVQRHRTERERHATAVIEAQKRAWLGRQAEDQMRRK